MTPVPTRCTWYVLCVFGMCCIVHICDRSIHSQCSHYKYKTELLQVLEYMQRGDLLRVLHGNAGRISTCTPLGDHETWAICRQVALGLLYLHHQVCSVWCPKYVGPNPVNFPSSLLLILD